jgi:circadian clock protein KaiC
MSAPQGISKSPTGVEGFDELTLGGVPTGRPTLVCGSAGCGKTLFATTFLIHGARDCAEPGVFVTFEERPGDIVSNVASLGFALDRLVHDQKIAFEYISLDRSELEEAGDYDLEGLFLRLEAASRRWRQVSQTRPVPRANAHCFFPSRNPLTNPSEI